MMLNKFFKYALFVIALSYFGLILCGFSTDNTDNYNPMYQIEETYISGHKYVVAYGKRGVTGISIIHSESCSCNKK